MQFCRGDNARNNLIQNINAWRYDEAYTYLYLKKN